MNVTPEVRPLNVDLRRGQSSGRAPVPVGRNTNWFPNNARLLACSACVHTTTGDC
jgi:hypothetical protein